MRHLDLEPQKRISIRNPMKSETCGSRYTPTLVDLEISVKILHSKKVEFWSIRQFAVILLSDLWAKWLKPADAKWP